MSSSSPSKPDKYEVNSSRSPSPWRPLGNEFIFDEASVGTRDTRNTHESDKNAPTKPLRALTLEDELAANRRDRVPTELELSEMVGMRVPR